VYALFASGLTLIFGVMRIINIAHGAFLVLAALFTFELWRRLGIDPLLSVLITTPAMFVIGWLVYRTLIARIRTAPVSMSVLLTFALAITIEGIMGMTWKNVFRSVTPSYYNESFHLGRSSCRRALYGAPGGRGALSLYLLLTRTWVGRAIRGATRTSEERSSWRGHPSSRGVHLRRRIATTGAGGSVLSVTAPSSPHRTTLDLADARIVVWEAWEAFRGRDRRLDARVAEALTARYRPQWAVVVFYV
jgi:branched-chain amino acid transport system permease protein